MTQLEVNHLSVRYGHLTAVHDVSLTLDRGEIVLLLGTNGAGKTSTLNAICGAIQPRAGSIVIDGVDMTGRPAHVVARSGLTHVPEGRRIIAPLSVHDNLLLGGYTVKSADRRNEILALVYETFPILDERKSMPGGLLSGGEQQMLAFGRALMSDPSMMLLDEPSMGLAPVMVKTVFAVVAQIAASGISILMVEQNAAAAVPIADRLYVMEQGEITLEGSAAALATDPILVKSFLGIQ